MRDAIVISGWTWEAFNVPERIALALAYGGARVLYCENPISLARSAGRPITEVTDRVFAFGPVFFGNRLNAVSMLSKAQAILVANQILMKAAELGLTNPIVIYPHGLFYLAICREFKRRGVPLVHICMDYELSDLMERVQLSDITLAIPRVAFEELRSQFGEKVRSLPQLGNPLESINRPRGVEPPEFCAIARPRLGYLGDGHRRFSVRVLHELLSAHPAWQFLSFGANKTLMLNNEHVLPWRSRTELPAVVDALDVGLLPYDCTEPKNLHCVPLKLFDYFARGIPVVSTPIVYLQEYQELVYLGATAEELAEGISRALSEGKDSPQKTARVNIARRHSIENSSQILCSILADLLN
jgi:hypothetical protein